MKKNILEKNTKHKHLIIQLGHLWEPNTERAIGWSGWEGTMICKRCLSVIKGIREDDSSPFKYEWMVNIQGDEVHKKDWHKCPSDNILF